jgi:ketosteroid isomerase-like protein
MAGNADVLKRGYEAFGNGDLEGAMQDFADDIRWEGPNADGLPDSGVFNGKDEVAQMFQRVVETYGQDLSVTPDEFHEDGDTVIVLGHLAGSPNGNRFKVPYAHVWRFEGGKASRMQALFDTAVVKEAIGA